MSTTAIIIKSAWSWKYKKVFGCTVKYHCKIDSSDYIWLWRLGAERERDKLVERQGDRESRRVKESISQNLKAYRWSIEVNNSENISHVNNCSVFTRAACIWCCIVPIVARFTFVHVCSTLPTILNGACWNISTTQRHYSFSVYYYCYRYTRRVKNFNAINSEYDSNNNKVSVIIKM